MTQDLYNAADVKIVRDNLLKEQGNKDLITGLHLASSDAVCDHDHDTQYVRGIIHRQTNVILGKIENAWKRYMAYWYKGSLPDFLRRLAVYLERKKDHRYLHPQWLKACHTMFNKLTEPQKKLVLQKLGQPPGANTKERKVLFQRALLTKQHGYDTIRSTINKVKGV